MAAPIVKKFTPSQTIDVDLRQPISVTFSQKIDHASAEAALKTVAAAGRTVVMTSHDLARAEDLATRFDILSRGVISATATKNDLKQTNLLLFYKEALAG